jgi:hypothetical protein
LGPFNIYKKSQEFIRPQYFYIKGLNYPSSWQGQSLLHKRTRQWSYHFSFGEPMNWGAVVYHSGKTTLKYSRRFARNIQDESEYLTDIEKDPEEKTNLINQIDPNFLREFRKQADEHMITDENVNPADW